MLNRLRKRWGIIISEMTLEPAMLLQMIGLGMNSVVVDTLLIERVCSNHVGIDANICKNLSSYESFEKETSAVVSIYQMFGGFINSGFPIFFAFFLGAWIDLYGTRIPMLLSVFGFVCSSLLNLIFSLKTDLPPWVLLLGGTPAGFTGGITAFIMAVITFISRKTTEKNRSFRIGVMESGWYIGSTTGVQLGSMIFEKFGYSAVFFAAACFFASAFVYILLFMKEDHVPPTAAPVSEQPVPYLTRVSKLFQVASIKQTIQTCFKKREGSRRLWVLLLITMICIRGLAQDEAFTLAYLYTRAKFGWNNKSYSIFLQVETMCRFVGLLIMIPAMRAFKWRDTAVGIFSSCGYVVTHLVFAFASSGWMMYLGSAISVPCVLISIIIRSSISKLVEKDELGRVYSLVAIGEALCVPLISSAIFNPIYSNTIHTFPGLIFVLAAAIHAVLCVEFVYLFCTMKNVEKAVDEEHTSTINLT